MFVVYLRNSPFAFQFTSLSYFSLSPRGHYIKAGSVYAAVQAQKQIQNLKNQKIKYKIST